LTCAEIIKNNELDGDFLLDGLFQDSWELEARPSRPSASPSQIDSPWSLGAAPSNLPAPASDDATPLQVSVDLPLDRGGRLPRQTLDFAVAETPSAPIDNLDGERDGNFVMHDDSLDKAATGSMFDPRPDILPFHDWEREAGQLLPPAPPAPLSQPLFPCLLDDYSLPAPTLNTDVGPPPALPTSWLQIEPEDTDPQSSLQSKTLVFSDEVAWEIEGDARMLDSSLDNATIGQVLGLPPTKPR